MIAFIRQRIIMLISTICLLGILAVFPKLIWTGMRLRDLSVPNLMPTTNLLVTGRAGGAEGPFDSPLPTPLPTETPVRSYYAHIALQYLAEQRGVPIETLLIENEHPRSYLLLDREFTAFTILDTNDGQAFVLLVDTNTEDVVDDLAALEQANAAAHLTKYGKLDPALYERLQTVDETTQLPVAVWVVSNYSSIEEKLYSELASKYPEVAEALERDASPFDIADDKQSEELRKEWADSLQRELDLALKPLIADLETQSIIVEKPKHLPSLVAKLNKTQIMALAERDEVQMLYLVEGQGQPGLDIAVPTNRAPAVFSRGFNGAGRTIAVVEDGNVDHDNSYLNISGTSRTGCAGENDHATLVASAAASFHNIHRGMAPGATILSAGVNPCTVPEIYNSLNWALDNSAHVSNFSYGVDSNLSALEWLDMAFDYAARTRTASIIVLAGNFRNRHIWSPGRAWNVITVGGTNDQGSVAWSDDVMYQSGGNGSAYFNPAGGTQGDREKPEVVAPAQGISGIGTNDTTLAFSGTSFAAPQVAGLAAVMMQRNSQIYSYPLAVKAVLMATAVHNIEGSRRLSDEDGAGSIDAALADFVAQNRGASGAECASPCWWAFNTTSSNPSVGGERTQTFQASRGERIRVAVAWWSAAGVPLSYPLVGIDTLATNFDLRIYKPSNSSTPVASSTSIDNNYEIVDFTAPETGVYTISVRKQAATESNNTLGIAWVKLATYLPEVRRNHDGWTSTIYVRNDGRTNWEGKITFFNQDGSYANETTTTLARNAVWRSATPPNNWIGSAIVNGSDDISVVVRHDKTGIATLDNGIAAGGATDPAWGQVGKVLYAPALYNNAFGGYNSTVFVQNSSATTIDVTLNLKGRTGHGDYLASATLAPQEQEVISINGYTPNGWVGSLELVAGQPVAVKISEGKGAGESRSYTATAVGNRLLYVPAAYRTYLGFESGLVIQNLHSSTNTVVTLKYCRRGVTNPATCPSNTKSVTALRAVGVNLSTEPVTAGFSGTVSLQSSGTEPLAALINNTNSTGGYAVNASGYGSKLIILPRAAKNASGRTSGFTLRNVSGRTIEVMPAYYEETGTLTWRGDARQATQNQPITLLTAQSIGFHLGSDCLPPSGSLCLPSGWEGSVVLEATGEIVALMREDVSSSTTAGYNGVAR
jgi:hypothetical protein